MSSRDLTHAARGDREPHTPGPWRVSTDREQCDIVAATCVVATAGNMGCDSAYPQSERRPHVLRAQANARLIAAAPEMLEALRAVIRVADRKTVEFDLAHAAIAKATGQ